MRNRFSLSYALDFTGIVALSGASAALGGALWLSASAAEAVLLTSFKYALMTAVAALLLARASEIAQIMRRETPALETATHSSESAAVPSNVESLPQRDGRLPRAA